MDFLYRDASYGLIICKSCREVIAIDDKYRIRSNHFFKNHTMSKPEWKKLYATICDLQPCTFSQAKRKLGLDQPIQPIQYIPILDGFACTTCQNWLSLNQRAASEHVQAMHNQESGISLNGLRPCKLQKLNQHNYFEVKPMESRTVAEPQQVLS